ncbi:MAG: hypothetical protein AAFO69_04650 [Bacteroidota bacterium]
MKRLYNLLLMLCASALSMQNGFSQCHINQPESTIFTNATVIYQTFTACDAGRLDQVNLYANIVDYDATIEVFSGASFDAGDLIDSKTFTDLQSVRLNGSTVSAIFDIKDLGIDVVSGSVYTFRISSITSGKDLNAAYNSSGNPYSGGVGGISAFPIGTFPNADAAFSVLIDLIPEQEKAIFYGNSFDVTSASFTTTTNNPLIVTDQESIPRGLTFSPDGTKMYTIGLGDDAVYQYDLSTAYDITTASFTAETNNPFPIADQSGFPLDVDFSTDGFKMFVLDGSAEEIHQYTLTTAFDVTTASVDMVTGNPLSVSSQAPISMAMAFSQDGRKLYVLDTNVDEVNQFELNTAFDITTAAYVARTNNPFSITDDETSPQDIAFSPDGRFMFILGDEDDGDVTQYVLSIPYDITTASLLTAAGNPYDVSGLDGFTTALAVSHDGSKLYTVGDFGNSVFQHDLNKDGFEETDDNNGSVTGQISLFIVGETFTNAGGTLTMGDDYSIDNLPAGLVPAITVDASGDTAILTLSGNALANMTTDDVSSLQFSFENSAFTGGDASVIENSTSAGSGLSINFLGQEITWDGSSSTDWSVAENWSTNTVPTSDDDVIIPDVSSIDAPEISSGVAVEVNNLTIEGFGTLLIDNDNPTASTEGGSLTIHGDFENAMNGSLTIESGASVILNGDRSGGGSETVLRNVAGSNRLSIVGAPLNGLTIASLAADLVFGYDNDNGNFTTPMASAGLTPGTGYFISQSTTDYQLDLSGTLVTGQVDVSITEESVSGSDAFNLVANPYAAAIDADMFFANANNTANTTGVIYLWDDGDANVGGDRGGDYITVNSAGSVGTTNPGNGVGGVKGSATFDGEVLSAQGFFVEATADGMVSFTTDMMVTGANSDANFFKESTLQTVKLSISNEEGLYNETLVAVTEKATSGIDYSLDARKLSANNDLVIYSWIGDEHYAIQSVPADDEVFLGLDVSSAGTYLLKIEDLNVQPGVTFYLTDYVSGQVYDLSAVDEIKLNLEASADTKRFLLSQKQSVVSQIEEELIEGLSIIQGDESGLTISYPLAAAEVNLVSLTGQTLLNGKYNFEEGTVRLQTSMKYGQVYILKVGQDVVRFAITQ